MRYYVRMIWYFFLKLLREICEKFGLERKRIIIIDAPYFFHFEHMRSLVDILSKNKKLTVIVTKWEGFEVVDYKGDVIFKNRNEIQNNIFSIYDLYITTEMNLLIWSFSGLIKCMLIPHGVAPKVSYIQDELINKFDYLFSPGPRIKKLQLEVFNQKSKILESGLPISDKIISFKGKTRKSNDRKTILYAPSWSSNPNMISMDENILNFLRKQDLYNVIIRPHPLLMNPDKCSGKDWKSILEKVQCGHVQLHNNSKSTIYEVLAESDILISDISSVLYEYMLLDRPVVIYDSKNMYAHYGANEELNLIKPAVDFVTDITELSPLLNKLMLNYDKLSKERIYVVEETFFRPGNSSEYTANKIVEISEK